MQSDTFVINVRKETSFKNLRPFFDYFLLGLEPNNVTQITLHVNPEYPGPLEVDFNELGINVAEVVKWPIKPFIRLSFEKCPLVSLPLESGPNFVLGCNLSHMFSNTQFNGSLGNHFDTSNVTNMSHMFSQSPFNQPLGNHFDTSNVTNMSDMFSDSSFNQPLGNHFNTSKVTDMSYMFSDSSFNHPLGEGFYTSNVTDMSDMFSRSLFNYPLGDHFDTSNVTNMRSMFLNSRFNQPLGDHFDTSNVTNTSLMFLNSSFNQPLGDHFNTSNVTNMSFMFSESQFWQRINLILGRSVNFANFAFGTPIPNQNNHRIIKHEDGTRTIQIVYPFEEEEIDETIINEGVGLEDFYPERVPESRCGICSGHLITVKEGTTCRSVLRFSLTCNRRNPNAILHIFHSLCFRTWLARENRCPVENTQEIETRRIIIPEGISIKEIKTKIDEAVEVG
jgi:hypothetical protein